MNEMLPAMLFLIGATIGGLGTAYATHVYLCRKIDRKKEYIPSYRTEYQKKYIDPYR
jgi:hypothetical protein